MNEDSAVRIRELRALANQFRAKAEETQLSTYIELMIRSAAELDRLADELEDRGMFPAARASCG